MRRVFLDDHHYQNSFYVGDSGGRKSYSCLGFLGDIFMTVITSGFWLLWVFVREMRRR